MKTIILLTVGVTALVATAGFTGASWWREHQRDVKQAEYANCLAFKRVVDRIADRLVGNPDNDLKDGQALYEKATAQCWSDYYARWSD